MTGPEPVAPSLAGRRRELGAVSRLLDRAAAGVGGHLVVTGPSGAGKTALAGAAAALAAARGLPVTTAPAALAGTRRLVVLDDADRADRADRAELVARLTADGAAVLITAVAPLGLPPEVHLGGVPEPDLAPLLPGLSPGAAHAVWLLSGGLPGPALDFAAGLGGTDLDAVVVAALAGRSRAGFLELDAGLVRLLRYAAEQHLPGPLRARVLGRLARELLGDASAAAHRRDLADQALTLARASGDPGTVAAVLDDRLHALWEPAGAAERLEVAGQIVEQAGRAGDLPTELRGLFWRFTALVELADLGAAEATLVAYGRAAELSGDAEAAVVVLSRQAVLALVRGRFDLVEELVAQVAQRGRAAGLPDTDRLVATLAGNLALVRGTAGTDVTRLRALARRIPGQYFEATAARVLVEGGAEAEAALELTRLLPAVLAGGGPRWVGAVADLGVVAARVGEPPAVEALYAALGPFEGRLVVWGGANTVTGPVDDVLGRLAARLGRTGEAGRHFDRAVALEERLGALPWLAATLAERNGPGDAGRAASIAARLGLVRPDAGWALARDGEDWVLRAGTETARLRAGRGVDFLRALLAAPGQEIAALDLAAGGAGLRPGAAEPVLDGDARRAYRRRLAALEAELAAADRSGDRDAAARADAERSALVAELRAATGLGGRPRTSAAEEERARVNTTRAIRSTVERIAAQAPLAGAHLSTSLRTGRYLRYQPAPGGPTRWRL
ncbi:AAA family ATPase [Cryptosporangium japonicum]|uniref:Orc1-like AAA ATPase domain-containing protein n=1 Tax=Cryptosporangium japonicum TaxID=80872 RepID=A0ABP3DRY2_9ACTN